MTELIIVGRKANTWGWGLEEALRRNAQGGKITILDFGGQSKPSLNPRSKFQAEALHRKNIKVIPWNSVLSRGDYRHIRTEAKRILKLVNESENWIDFEYFGLPVGRILRSSYAKTERARIFQLTKIPVSMQSKIVREILTTYRIFTKLNIQIDEIVLSNGRGPTEATILHLARKNNINYSALESGANSSKFFSFKTSPHYAPDWWNATTAHSKTMSKEEIDSEAEIYWSKKLIGIDESSNRDWSKEFKSNLLPTNLPEKFFTYFCTSEHEVPVFDDFEDPRPEFSNQQEAVKALASICESMDIFLVIKRHPNSISKTGSDREKSLWEWTQGKTKILYLDPRTKFDSYALMRKSAAVLTYKSSTGIEAAAHGIPSRALGPAKWAFMEASRADSREKLIEFLKNPTILDTCQAQIWGAFMNSFGQKLVLFSEIRNGYALADGIRYYASDYYLGRRTRMFEKFHRRIIDAARLKRPYGG